MTTARRAFTAEFKAQIALSNYPKVPDASLMSIQGKSSENLTGKYQELMTTHLVHISPI